MNYHPIDPRMIGTFSISCLIVSRIIIYFPSVPMSVAFYLCLNINNLYIISKPLISESILPQKRVIYLNIIARWHSSKQAPINRTKFSWRMRHSFLTLFQKSLVSDSAWKSWILTSPCQRPLEWNENQSNEF